MRQRRAGPLMRGRGSACFCSAHLRLQRRPGPGASLLPAAVVAKFASHDDEFARVWRAIEDVKGLASTFIGGLANLGAHLAATRHLTAVRLGFSEAEYDAVLKDYFHTLRHGTKAAGFPAAPGG